MMGKRDSGHAGDGGNSGQTGAGLASDAGLAVDEAAAHAGVSDRTIRRALKARPGTAGHLPSWRVKGPRGSEYRISPVEVDLWMGRRDALDALDADGEDGQTGTVDSEARQDSQARGASPARLADQGAALSILIEQVVAPIVAHLGRTQHELGAVREELGRERTLREAAEREAAELRRARRRLPWWLRVLLGGR